MKLKVLLTLLCLTPTVDGQFGVGNRKQQQQQNTKFQELQEMAKKQASGGTDAAGGFNIDSLADLWSNADPNTMETMKQYGEQFNGVLEQMMKMSPDELQKTMQDAMNLMTQGDIVDTVLTQKDTVLKTLETTGMVPADELEKYKKDPEYFELKMRESFDQMKDLLTNPEYVNKATEAVQSMKEYMDNPSKITELAASMTADLDWTSDDKLEEVRLQFLNGDVTTGIPGLDQLFQSDEMKAVLQDPVKWRETVKDGLEDLVNLGIKKGAESAALNIDGTKAQ